MERRRQKGWRERREGGREKWREGRSEEAGLRYPSLECIEEIIQERGPIGVGARMMFSIKLEERVRETESEKESER
eukprot:2145192-Rhodomonas_salina.1